MRIVQLVPSLDDGELAQEALEFAVEVARQGHDSAVISAGGALVSRLTLHNCQHFELPLNQKRWFNGRLHRKLRQQVQALDADVLLCRGPICAWRGAQIWKRLPEGSRPRLVTSIHQWPAAGLFQRRRINTALAQGELVLSASDGLGQQLSQRYTGILRDAGSQKLRTLYRGVNTRELDKNAPVSGHWHHRLLNDFPQLEERNWLLLPGPIGPGRGQEQFLSLLEALKQASKDDGFIKALKASFDSAIADDGGNLKEAVKQGVKAYREENKDSFKTLIVFLGALMSFTAVLFIGVLNALVNVKSGSPEIVTFLSTLIFWCAITIIVATWIVTFAQYRRFRQRNKEVEGLLKRIGMVLAFFAASVLGTFIAISAVNHSITLYENSETVGVLDVAFNDACQLAGRIWTVLGC